MSQFSIEVGLILSKLLVGWGGLFSCGFAKTQYDITIELCMIATIATTRAGMRWMQYRTVKYVGYNIRSGKNLWSSYLRLIS